MFMKQGWFCICVLLFAGIAVLLLSHATSLYGVGISSNSTEYIRLARDIVYNGFQFLGKKEAIYQPPVYPALLALASVMTGSDPLIAARGLNVVIYAAIVVLIMLTVRRVTQFLPIIIAMSVLSCFSIPLFNVSSMAWPDPFFVLLVYAILFLVTSAAPPSIIGVCLLALLTSFACLTRYAGVVLIPFISAYLLLFGSEGWLKRLKVAFTFSTIASFLFGIFIFKNYLISGTSLGSNYPVLIGYASNITLTIRTFIRWFLPWHIYSFKTALFTVSSLIGVFLWCHRHHVIRQFDDSRNVLFIYTGFFVLFTAFIVWTSTTKSYETSADRLLLPVYPSLIVLFSFVLKPETWGGRWRSILGVFLFSLLFVVTPFRSVVAEVNNKYIHGAGGYAATEWQRSPLVDYFKKRGQPENERIYSNAADVLYILANVSAQYSPASRDYNSEKSTGLTPTNLFVRYPYLDGAILVWFDRAGRNYLCTPEELSIICSVKPISKFEDGTIYRIGHATNRIELNRK